MKEKTVSDRVDHLWQVIEPYVAAEGTELDDLEVRGEGPGTVVRVIVDDESAVDVDVIARLSRGLSRLLDAEDMIAGSYTLEVTSPGLERPLRRPRHYEKSVGREVKVKTRAAGETVHHRGLLHASDETGFTLDVDGTHRRIAYADVANARTLFTWEKAARPGTRRVERERR